MSAAQTAATHEGLKRLIQRLPLTHTYTHKGSHTHTETVTYTCRDTHTSTGAHTVRDDARTTDLNAIALKYVVSCSLSTGYGC